jgi:hypothetical protein
VLRAAPPAPMPAYVVFPDLLEHPTARDEQKAAAEVRD